MANLRMVVGSLADAATLTATSEAGDLVASNLQRSGRETLWRSNTPHAVISGRFAAPDVVNCLVIAHHNFSGTSSIRLELLLYEKVVLDTGPREPVNLIPVGEWRAGIDPFGGSYDDQMPARIARFWLDGQVVADSFRLTIADPDNSAGFVEAGRLFMGRYFSPTHNMGWGAGVQWLDASEHMRLEGGGIETVVGQRSRRISFDLSLLPEDDRELIESHLAMQPIATDVFLSLYPERGDQREITHQIIARRESDLRLSHQSAPFWGTELTFIEV